MRQNIVQVQGVPEAATAIARHLRELLDEYGSVLWLTSGGSCIEVAVQVRRLLDKGANLGGLHVGLIDERFGPVGHKDSNWQQLLDSGFDSTGVATYPVLTGQATAAIAAEEYSVVLAQLSRDVGVSFGLFGMGVDGHTAGLLPENTIMESEQLVDSYEGPDFVRISVTPRFIQSLDDAALFALGAVKWPAFEQSLQPGLAAELPVRVLQSIASIKVYTDYEGGRV